jgi:hypothetical protein
MTETDDPTTTLRAPGATFTTYRDALGLLRTTYRDYTHDDTVTREAATKLRTKLGDLTNGFETGTDHEVELTHGEFVLLWSGVTDMLTERDSTRVHARAQRGADYLTRAETTPDDGSELPVGADVWDLND